MNNCHFGHLIVFVYGVLDSDLVVDGNSVHFTRTSWATIEIVSL